MACRRSTKKHRIDPDREPPSTALNDLWSRQKPSTEATTSEVQQRFVSSKPNRLATSLKSATSRLSNGTRHSSPGRLSRRPVGLRARWACTIGRRDDGHSPTSRTSGHGQPRRVAGRLSNSRSTRYSLLYNRDTRLNSLNDNSNCIAHISLKSNAQTRNRHYLAYS